MKLMNRERESNEITILILYNHYLNHLGCVQNALEKITVLSQKTIN